MKLVHLSFKCNKEGIRLKVPKTVQYPYTSTNLSELIASLMKRVPHEELVKEGVLISVEEVQMLASSMFTFAKYYGISLKIKSLKASTSVYINSDSLGYHLNPRASDIVGIILTDLPETFKRCKRCLGLVSEGAAPTKTSKGGEILLCGSCKSLKPCAACGFQEPYSLMRAAIRIDANGRDNHFNCCEKCADSFLLCPVCNYYFNQALYPKCPCRMPSNFKPMIKPHNDDVLKYYQADDYCNELFGIEIEAGALNTNRVQYSEILESTNKLIENTAILKYDSSIDWIDKNNGVDNKYKGFEVVTRPLIYKNALRFLRQFCKNRHPLLRSWEVGTCGLHIHISKACLRPFEIGKILKFINNPKNRPFIKMIAKREDKRFAKFIPKKIMDYRDMHPNCHYQAVNTSKQHTVEIRVFRGSLNPETVVSYLQFVKSLVDFVRVTELYNLTYKQYIMYLFSTDKSSFRELKRRIESENLKQIEERGEI